LLKNEVCEINKKSEFRNPQSVRGGNPMSPEPKVNILLVDDRPEDLLAEQAVLQDLGQNIVTAQSGEEALLRLLENDFAMILLDVSMPGMDGFETAALIRRREKTEHTPIVFLTGVLQTELDRLKGYVLGAVDYLYKPVMAEILKAKVATFVDLFQQQKLSEQQAERLRTLEHEQHERELAEARLQWELERLREESEQRKKAAEAMAARAEELALAIAERERTEQRFRDVLENMQVIAVTLDVTGRVTFCNEYLLNLTGTTREEVIGCDWFDRFVPAERADVKELFLTGITSGQIAPFYENEIRTKSDTIRFVAWTNTVLRDATGNITGTNSIGQDITERKWMEEKLKLTHEQLAATVNALPDLMFEVDREGRIHDYRGPESEKPYVPVEGFLGKTVNEVLPPEAADIITGAMAEALEHGHHRGAVYSLPLPDGLRWYELSIAHRGDPQAPDVRLIVLARDITDRKRAEEALRTSTQRINDILESITDAFFTLDRQWRFDYVNAQAERLLRRQRSELLGKSVWDEFPEAVGSTFYKEYHRAIAERTSVAFEEFYPPLATWFEVHAYPYPAGLSVYFRDITERRRVDEQLQEANERLQALSRRLLEIQEQERRYVARELHDEIGQSLTAVKINLQAMQQAGDDCPVGHQLQESIGIVEEALQQVRALSHELRPSMLDDFGLVSALRWYLDRLAGRVGLATDLTVDPSFERQPPHIETACFRIVQEATTNIVRHAHAKQAWVQLSQADGDIVLTISDDGDGFEVRAARDRIAEGASLGLLGMEERAVLAGGRLEISSSAGQGTEVVVRFPGNKT
jgi:PAS domain S-box-containing protein